VIAAEDATNYFKRVRGRSLSGGRMDSDTLTFTFGGPPTREPRNGRVVVHNRVAHTLTQIPGIHGFRAWTQLKDDDCIACRCGWGGVKHYRFRGQPAYVYAGARLASRVRESPSCARRDREVPVIGHQEPTPTWSPANSSTSGSRRSRTMMARWTLRSFPISRSLRHTRT
jgi:hypothetical protein